MSTGIKNAQLTWIIELTKNQGNPNIQIDMINMIDLEIITENIALQEEITKIKGEEGTRVQKGFKKKGEEITPVPEKFTKIRNDMTIPMIVPMTVLTMKDTIPITE